MRVHDPCPFCWKVGFRPVHEDQREDENGMCPFPRFTDGGEMASGELFRKIDKVYEETGECPPHHWQRKTLEGTMEGNPGLHWECANCDEVVGQLPTK